MAIPLFKHSNINKGTQAQPYMIVQHARYIMRKSASLRVCSEHMPRNYHAVLRFLTGYEDGLRKNGRIDKFIIAVPREVSPDQAEEVLRRFGRRIGKGKAPFLFALHWDAHNPHAHFVFLDRDPETGRRVFGTSELKSTAKLKFEWETEANDYMASLGIDARIDFAEAERNAANDNELHQDNEPPEPVAEQEEAPDEGEDEMATIEYPQAEATISRDEWLGNLQATVHEMYVLDRKRREYVTAEAQYKHWRKEAVAAREEAREAEGALQLAYSKHFDAKKAHEDTHLFGRRKGIKLFGFKTEGYKKAEQAEQALTSAEYMLGMTRETAREAEAYRAMATAKVQEYEDKLMGEERQMSRIDKVYGKQMVFDEAEGELKDTFAYLTKDLTPEMVLEMHENGEISWATAKDFLHFMGHDSVIAEVEQDRDASL